MRLDLITAAMRIWRENRCVFCGTIEGKSMLPIVPEGAIATYLCCTWQEIRIGDLVVFLNPSGRMRVHRVLARISTAREISFIEKGDNSLFPARMSASAIVGKIISLQIGERILDMESPYWCRANLALALYHWALALLSGGALLLWANRLSSVQSKGPVWLLRIWHWALIRSAAMLPRLVVLMDRSARIKAGGSGLLA